MFWMGLSINGVPLEPLCLVASPFINDHNWGGTTIYGPWMGCLTRMTCLDVASFTGSPLKPRWIPGILILFQDSFPQFWHVSSFGLPGLSFTIFHHLWPFVATFNHRQLWTISKLIDHGWLLFLMVHRWFIGSWLEQIKDENPSLTARWGKSYPVLPWCETAMIGCWSHPGQGVSDKDQVRVDSVY